MRARDENATLGEFYEIHRGRTSAILIEKSTTAKSGRGIHRMTWSSGRGFSALGHYGGLPNPLLYFMSAFTNP